MFLSQLLCNYQTMWNVDISVRSSDFVVSKKPWQLFDQQQRHQLHFTGVATLERDTPGLYTMYISNLDPTWRILFQHLHLKGPILISEFHLEPRWTWFSFSFHFFPQAAEIQWAVFFFLNRILNSGRKCNDLSQRAYTFSYNLLKRLHWHSHWCKTKGWGSKFHFIEAAAIWI